MIRGAIICGAMIFGATIFGAIGRRLVLNFKQAARLTSRAGL